MYFVILNHPNPNNHGEPLVDEDEYIAYFDDIESARAITEKNPLGDAFGYEIFQLGTGEQ